MTPSHSFRLTQVLVVVAAVATLAAPAAALGGSASGPAQLSPTERIVRQEDARRYDPAIYGGTWAVGFPGPRAARQLSPAERIARQEDARRYDPAIYGGTWVAGFPRSPVASPARQAIEIVASGGFDWVDAGLGAGAALAVVALATGAVILARAAHPLKA